jgi:hypothetical protein
MNAIGIGSGIFFRGRYFEVNDESFLAKRRKRSSGDQFQKRLSSSSNAYRC